MRVQVILECTETKLRHYTTTKIKDSSRKIGNDEVQSSIEETYFV